MTFLFLNGVSINLNDKYEINIAEVIKIKFKGLLYKLRKN